ncbi:MAG: aspartate aminotransferase family protein [Pseudomonadota bacterium]|uniref:aspartate aminotransferase family protein n=1 Tax=Alcanivorax sp. TaxID=1872427 RepID=UPI0025BA7EF1|nr:aspartate aminotransferase family protein [Alcanivorax sp.]MEE3321703.1 aspartate aminotransferase family protein [Pseudomonadota bacterium]
MSHLSPLLVQSSGICAERGEGSWLYDKDGTRWLDFTSGIGVTATGHCHPKVVAAAQEQVAKLVHAQYATVKHPNMLALTDRLYSHLPKHMDAVAFSNSGSESVEAAFRLARQATGRPNIVVFRGGFHGRTMGAASLTTSNNKVRTGWAPLMAGVSVAPFPHAYRYGWDEDTAVDFCLKELDHLMITECNPKDTAAMIIEPVQGEYGYYPAPKRFMEGLQARCKEHGILLIVDEIQAGYGRTGKFWSHEHSGVSGDILITAKGLASGYPLSAIAASKELMEHGYPGSQGGTYGANVVACAAALATLDVIEEEQLVARADKLGNQLVSQLEGLKAEHDCIDEIRGAGLMLGVEMVSAPHTPDGDRAARILKHCEQNGMLMLRCGSHGQVVRWLPPLTVTEAEMEQAVSLFEAALKET